MSLIDEALTACKLQTCARAADGEGGYTTTWADGAEFYAAIVLNTSAEETGAERHAARGQYTVTCPAQALVYHDVFKRTSDGKVFRVTSDIWRRPPGRATFDFYQVDAEEWTLS